MDTHRNARLQRRQIVVAGGLLGLLAAPLSGVAQSRVIGVMSLLADELTVVGQEGTTGTKLDRNVRETVVIGDGAIERVVLGAALRAIGKADPGAKVMPMLVNEPRYYGGQRDWVDERQAALPPELYEALRGAGVTQLILVLKLRGDARLNTGRISLGSGRLEGLGFYIDRKTELRLEGTSKRSVGYLAPYLFARILLIDLESRRVIDKRDVARGEVVMAAYNDAPGADPWGWLDSKAKMQAISSMIERDVGEAVAALAKAP